ncbi:hypothetical protein D3C87_2163350 [compost metagenome]
MEAAKSQFTAYDINDMDIAIIKAQFMALGLITAHIGTSVKGTIHEYLSLTEQGRNSYMAAVVIRKT